MPKYKNICDARQRIRAGPDNTVYEIDPGQELELPDLKNGCLQEVTGVTEPGEMTKRKKIKKPKKVETGDE